MLRAFLIAGLLFTFAAASADSATFDRITFSRSICFGTCPAYTISVTRDGAISYGGDRFVAQQGARTATLDAAGVKRLDAALATADVDALRDSYASPDDGCDSLATDQPSEDFLIVRGGREKRIHYYLGCRGPRIDAELARLAALGDAIDSILDTKRWTGEPGAAHE
jgi:hypothetical protein